MKTITNISLLIVMLTGLILSQHYYDKSRSKRPKPSPVVLPVQVVKAADLGLHSTMSDLYWLSAIQYFGGWQTDGYVYMDDLIRLSNDMDPKFSYPYAFGALILPMIGQTDQAIEIAERGIADSEPDWRIPYYTATTYHIEKKDSANAAKYFDIAARTPGAPQNIQRIAASYGTRVDLREQTKAIWQGIYESSDDDVVRERAKNYLVHFEILDLLEQAAGIYKGKYGSYPDSIEKLVEVNILKFIPADPFGYTYSIDSEGRARIK